MRCGRRAGRGDARVPPGRGRRQRRRRGPGCPAAHGASGFRRPRLCGRRRLPPLAGGRRPMGRVAAARLPDPGHSRVRWPRRPARLPPFPAFRSSAGRRRPLRLDGRGAQLAGGLEQPHARLARPAGLCPRRSPRGARRGVRDGGRGRRAVPLQAGGGRGGQGIAAPPAGRHPGHLDALPAARHGLRHRPRPPAPQRGARTLPARRPLRPTADDRHLGRAERVGDRLDRGPRRWRTG